MSIVIDLSTGINSKECRLKSLDISKCKCTEKGLNSVLALSLVVLRANKLSGVYSLNGLKGNTTLRSLELNRCTLKKSCLPNLLQLGRLTSLSLSEVRQHNGYKFGDMLLCLLEIPSIRRLDLSCNLVRGELLRSRSIYSKSISSLDLAYNDFKENCIGYLPRSLTSLSLVGNGLEEECIPYLSMLTNLTSLKISNNRLSSMALSQLTSNLLYLDEAAYSKVLEREIEANNQKLFVKMIAILAGGQYASITLI